MCSPDLVTHGRQDQGTEDQPIRYIATHTKDRRFVKIRQKKNALRIALRVCVSGMNKLIR